MKIVSKQEIKNAVREKRVSIGDYLESGKVEETENYLAKLYESSERVKKILGDMAKPGSMTMPDLIEVLKIQNDNTMDIVRIIDVVLGKRPVGK